ncbi:MAG: HAD family phosphatase [Gammaproteobacteria bacterium]|nr:HAD family phosphatase [Gammaproteobacteria bacterium]
MARTAFCFDLDGTITSEEILPLLARELDIEDEIRTLTDATIRGLIVFESSFKLRIRLLRDLSLSTARDIVSGVRLQQDVVDFIQRNSDDCFIVTGNLDVYIGGLADRIGCQYFSASTLSEDDRLISIDQMLDKGKAVRSLRDRYEQIVVIGDGMNDVPMFEEADIGIAYGGVHPPVNSLVKLADFVTYDKAGLCNILNTLS